MSVDNKTIGMQILLKGTIQQLKANQADHLKIWVGKHSSLGIKGYLWKLCILHVA